MHKKAINVLFTLLLLVSMSYIVHAQDISTKVVGDKFEVYRDSLETTPRLYLLPILGNKVQERGYDVQLPTGIQLVNTVQQQDLNINNLAVGFSDSLADISQLVVFDRIENNTIALSIRPDVWILPFWNIYGIYNRFWSRTNVKLAEPIELTIPEVRNDGQGVGIGTVLAYGFGPVWASANFNWAWSWTPVLSEPTQSFVTGLRIGTAIYNKKRTHSGAIWVGASYINYIGSNSGSYDLTQLLPDEKPRLEELLGQINEMVEGLNEKYDEFCNMPGNGPKCAIIDPILEEFKQRIEDKIDGIESPEELRINYSFNSEPAKNWNMLIGTQYNWNKRIHIRVEVGFINRTNVIASIDYRFGFLKRKN
jgi:hypothetical protein